MSLRMSAAAACRSPLRSRVPVSTNVMMKMHMLRFETKLSPSVFRNATGSIPPTTAVAMAATMMMRIESSLSAKPTTTMTIPRSLRSSVGSIGPPCT